jgi:hypothetical protein
MVQISTVDDLAGTGEGGLIRTSKREMMDEDYLPARGE